MPITFPALTQDISTQTTQPALLTEAVSTGFREPWAAWLARGAEHQPSVVGVTRFRQVVSVTGELVILVGIVFCLPLVILAVGIPIALAFQLLLWIGGLLP
jgi:hypothetical protein